MPLGIPTSSWALGNLRLGSPNEALVSQRGVVFLRDQDVTPEQMRDLMEKLTVLAGCVCVIPLPMSFAHWAAHTVRQRTDPRDSPNLLASTYTL